jgi:hypothetical protein
LVEKKKNNNIPACLPAFPTHQIASLTRRISALRLRIYKREREQKLAIAIRHRERERELGTNLGAIRVSFTRF